MNFHRNRKPHKNCKKCVDRVKREERRIHRELREMETFEKELEAGDTLRVTCHLAVKIYTHEDVTLERIEIYRTYDIPKCGYKYLGKQYHRMQSMIIREIIEPPLEEEFRPRYYDEHSYIETDAKILGFVQGELNAE